MCVFCIYLGTNRDFCPVQRKIICLYKRSGACLLRGTNWVLKQFTLLFQIIHDHALIFIMRIKPTSAHEDM